MRKSNIMKFLIIIFLFFVFNSNVLSKNKFVIYTDQKSSIKAKEVIQDSLGIIKSNDNLNETEILPNSNLNTTPLDSASAKGDEQSDEKL